MPWGCLCSKEKKRPQISSPILSPEDTQKLQLLPAVRRPLLSDAEKLEQRLLAPNANADFDNESSEETQPPNDAGRDRLQQQLLQKSRLKSSNLKSTTYTRNTENDKLTRHLNTVKFSFDEPVLQKPDGHPGVGRPLRKQTDRGDPPPKPDRRISTAATQQLVVKLPETGGNVSLDHQHGSITPNAADEIDCNGNGNYDIVPSIKISEDGVDRADAEGRTEHKASAQVDENKNEILVPGSSEGSIPFIDEDPTQILRQLNANPQRGQNFHDARIITLTPKNVGSEATRAAAASVATPASEQGHREAQLRLLADTKKFTRFLVEPPPVASVEAVKFTHIFQILPPSYDRLCQQCHKPLHLDIGLRCVVCDFTCHQQCVRLEKRKARYTDTSYLIFQQLDKGGVLYAFPLVVGLIQRSPKKTSPSVPSSPKPRCDVNEALVIDSPEESILGKHKKPNTYKAKDTRKPAGSGIPRRQSKIAEKRKNRRSLELKAVEEVSREEEETKDEPDIGAAEQDETKVQVCDISGRGADGSGTANNQSRTFSVISSDEPDSVQKDIQVAVDFHHRPNSEVEPFRTSVIEANNNDLRCKTANEIDRRTAGDSDVESVSTLTPSIGPGTELREVDDGPKGAPTGPQRMLAPGVQIRRKQYPYEPCYLVGSEFSDTSDFTDTASSVASDLDETEYARVELRKKNGREEEQQAINKYNSLPLHTINAQQQQQQQQPRPTTNLNHVNNNHYHNYSLQPYYNRQPQQQHSYPVTRIAEVPSPKSIRLNYVAERILASTLPARQLQNGSSSPHATNGTPPADEHERELINMLEQKYKQNYRILDLESRLVNITLEKLCELCKYIDSWLGSGKEKIVVLQDREDKHRLGTAVAAYLQYQKICGSNIPQASAQSKNFLSPGGTDNGRKTPTWLDLDIYSMQKFLESVTGPLRIPSHKRYIQYFSGLLSGVIKLNSSSFFLKAIRVESPPCLHYRAITVNSEWRSFIKIFEGVRCLFTSDIYVIPLTTRHFIYEIKHPLRLRGDILVRCYQIIPNNNMASYEKELIASVQFHTCAITEKEVQFQKGDLDLACQDERFSAEHMMTFCFDTVPNERSMVLIFQDPLVRKEPIVETGDHLETINEDESGHTQGPLDGSLYATILKSPKSPTAPHLISPPAEFSNGKSLLANGGGPPPPVPERSKTPNSIYLSHNGTPRSTPVPFAVAPPPVSPAFGNGSVHGDVKYALSESKSTHSVRSGAGVNSSYGSYQSASPGAPDGSSPGVVTLAPSGKPRPSGQVDGRESVRSPLTVSMDSGISSSGPVNRRIQGSSVSPSSFPSPQASPQDDRHRELDDLLSDMMLTVQGIPDVGQKADQTDHHQAQQRQQPHHHHHHQNPNDHFVNTNTDTIKRSHSAQLPVPAREDNRARTPLTVSDYSPSVAAAAKERELLMYETSSTTTTLTPPPSESGRETPLLSAYASAAIRERELQNINNNNLTPAERELIMSVQRHPHQSLAYPRPARSTTGASERFTSDDDDELLGGGSGGQIPYHAREDSRPFTYGNIPASGTPQHPPAATMIKMQSGLSSPSMVRKALGTPTATRKTATLPRNDFEEMLRERREKVLSEKYTIGDQSPGGMGGGGGMMVSDTINNNSGGDGRWTYQQHHTVKTVTTQGATPNGYPAHEPLKRSNTMDGSFGRQFSNEGISGQSWLQLQQQKLRARREQQRREHSNSFSYNYGSPAFPTGENVYNTTHRRSQTLSPVRNERNYHTLTTTRTHSTERPFVAVQRAHENAKLQTIGNAPLSILNASPHGHIAQAQTASSPSPSSTHRTVSSPAPSTGTSVTITNQHHHQTVNGSSSATGSPVNGQAHATPQQHRHINGNGVHYQQQQQQLNNSSLNGSSGLLSLAEQDHSTPKHGQVRLESEQIIFSNIHSLNNLDNCEKLNNLLNEITNSAAVVASVATSPEPQSTGTGTAASGGPACISPNITTASVTTNSSSSSSMSTSNHSASLINNHTHHLIDSYHDHQYRHRNGHKPPSGEQEPMELSSPDGSVDEKPLAQTGATVVNGERRNGHDTTPVTVIGHGQLALDKLLASLALESDVTEEHLAKIEGRTNTTGCYAEQRPTVDFHPSSELSDVLANLAAYDLTEMQRNGNLYHQQPSVDTANGNYRLYPAHGFELVNGYTLSNGHHHLPGQLQRSTSRGSNDATVAQQSHQHQQSQNSSPNIQQQLQQQQQQQLPPHHHHNHPHHPLLMNNHVRRIASETDSTISSISPSLSERSNAISWCDQAREESFSSYRSETEPDNSPMGGSPRPETPAFPVTPRTPYGLSNGTSSPALPPKSPTSQRKDLFSGNQRAQEIINQNETLSCYTSRRNSTTSNSNSEPQEVAPQFVKFARDSSKYWYKPNISREEAIALLRNAPPGTFIVRDSTTFANAYGLVVKVNQPPPGVQYTGPNSEELVRHFLVEPTIRGVRLKGCANEPVFTSLSALVYQHSITTLALPCRLIIPDMDLQQLENQTPAQQQLLQQGAACNVLYLFTCDTESLTGPQAIRKAVSSLLALRPLPKPTQVHFKASLQGITLTDNTRQLFFRRHYPSNNVSFCALDPDDRRWSIQSTTGDIPASKRMFAFVAKRSPSSADNQCHVFCELEPTQPAAAIMQFANKVLTGTSQQPAVTRAI